jgi:predicted membrane chloride channel (bestrophin family)
MKTLRDFLSVVNWHTFVVSLLAIGSTALCLHLDLEAEIPTGLIGLAVVFPIVFSINAAYRRREEALGFFGDLKAHAMSIYYAHRDWIPEGVDSREFAARSREQMLDVIRAIRDHFLEDRGRKAESFQRVHRAFSAISHSNELVRDAGIPARKIARINQYLSKMTIDFEKMRNILDYRTPVSLRSYSRVFLNAFPVLFGPYFTFLSSESYPAAGYLVALVYSLVLVTLDNIQEDLEDPFDMVGTDDVKLDVCGEYEPLLAGQPAHPMAATDGGD